VQFTYELFDRGRRLAVVQESSSQLAQAKKTSRASKKKSSSKYRLPTTSCTDFLRLEWNFRFYLRV